MKSVSLSRGALTLLPFLSALFFSNQVLAEDFTPIGGGYECVHFTNGNEYVVTAHNPDYSFADTTALSKQLVKERTTLKTRSADLNDLAPTYQGKKLSSSAKVQFKRLFKAIYFALTNTDFPDADSPQERKAIVAQLKRSIKQRQAEVAGFLKRINDCAEGRVVAPNGGEYIFPEVRLVGFIGTLQSKPTVVSF